MGISIYFHKIYEDLLFKKLKFLGFISSVNKTNGLGYKYEACCNKKKIKWLMGFDIVTNSITKCIDRVENSIGAFLIKLFYLHTIFILKFMHLMCK